MTAEPTRLDTTDEGTPGAARGFQREFVSLDTVALVAGVSHEMAYRWVRTGQLRAIRLGGTGWRVERTVLEEFLRLRPVGLSIVPTHH